MLALILGLVQLGVGLHARTVAAAAAAVADLGDGRLPGFGRPRSWATHADNGDWGRLHRSCCAFDVLVVTVSGRAPLFFDLGQGRIAETAVLPLEKVAR